MSRDCLPAVEIEPAKTADASVIWLHGLGADGHDFEAVVDALDLPAEWALRFVFPHAPKRPITLNGGFVMRGWYDIGSPDLMSGVDAAGIRQSQQQAQALIEREVQRGIPAGRIVLAGFSQGGVVALEAGSRYPQSLAGIIALSTYLPLAQTFPDCRQALPVFVGHGTLDTMVPLALGEGAARQLADKNYVVEWRTYPMAHAVCAEEIFDLRQWLLARLG